MSKRTGLKKISAAELVIDRTVNFRDDYDVPSMVEEIRSAGRILEPIHVRAEDKVTLKGNRRVSAAQVLLNDPTISDDLRKALENVDVFFYSDLTEKETTELVLDHGSQKPLSRVETVKAIWRLQKLMYSERDIITLMYHQLAKYTGNTRKAYEAQQINAGDQREKFLMKWLHGTVGNYILAAGRMGEFVREQFLLTDTAVDRVLTEDEKKLHVIDMARDFVGELASAMKEDKEGKGWNPETGGEKFNALLEKAKELKKNGKPRRNNNFTTEMMEQTGDTMQSGLRLAFRKCAGVLTEGESHTLLATDTEYHRRDKVHAVLTANVDRIADKDIRNMVQSILARSEKDVETSLAPFLSAAE